jgi:hypothetical protein
VSLSSQDGPVIYLSSRWGRQRELIGPRKLLQMAGFEVKSSWLDSKEEGDIGAAAQEDLRELAQCNTIVAFTEESMKVGDELPFTNTGGRHVEFGWAVGRGLKLIVVGPRENVFHHLSWVEQVADIAEVVGLLMQQMQAKGEEE